MYSFPARVLQLMNLTDSRLAQAGNEKLELAMLSFFEQFRKIYIGDQVQKSSKVKSLLLGGINGSLFPNDSDTSPRCHWKRYPAWVKKEGSLPLPSTRRCT